MSNKIKLCGFDVPHEIGESESPALVAKIFTSRSNSIHAPSLAGSMLKGDAEESASAFGTTVRAWCSSRCAKMPNRGQYNKIARDVFKYWSQMAGLPIISVQSRTELHILTCPSHFDLDRVEAMLKDKGEAFSVPNSGIDCSEYSIVFIKAPEKTITRFGKIFENVASCNEADSGLKIRIFK